MLHLPSPITTLSFEGRQIYIKRDDLIHPYFSGNKFRKLYALYNMPSKKLHTIISYGGVQSNAMLSLAALANYKGWHFHYYTKKLPKVIDEGNFTQAVQLGMKVFELSHEEYPAQIECLLQKDEPKVLVIKQGGAQQSAAEGIKLLADEIVDFYKSRHIETLSIVTPSGTGTTAYFLAKYLPKSINVYTTPSVGSSSYLQEQMQLLGELPSNLHIIETEKKYHFAKPYREFYKIYQKLLEEGVEFDLIYAPKTFMALAEHLQELESELLYIHSGGILGNMSMLKRYAYKKLI